MNLRHVNFYVELINYLRLFDVFVNRFSNLFEKREENGADQQSV
jgi:hypothetical protein